jgi:cathepsin A (carboxypeptidase C)
MGVNLLPFIWTLLFIVSQTRSAPEDDLVGDLPGIDFTLNFVQYSGYLEGQSGNHLHYWFVESQGDPETDPLVLWLTGGPGCSSLDALLEENGPIHIDDDGNPYLNPYSWNTVANIIYLESPVGVGFSYSDSGDYSSTDDDTVSLNNYLALQSFFNEYPEYYGRDFYITGESYGGIYVPTLAVRVLNGDLPINFQGIAIGNGLLSYPLNDNSLEFIARYHGIIGETLWDNLVSLCCDGVESAETCNFASPDNAACLIKVLESDLQTNVEGLNPYNILSPCEYSDDVASPMSFAKRLWFRDVKKVAKDLKLKTNIQTKKRKTSLKSGVGLDPTCIDSSNVADWLNQAPVRDGLHIAEEALDWEICSDEVNSNYDTLYTNMTAQFNELLPHIRILIYNGDFDIACNFLGDQWFVESLGQEVVKDYNNWNDGDGNVGGYGKSFQNITFTTIRGAGHMVPTDQPARALFMFTKFINDEEL